MSRLLAYVRTHHFPHTNIEGAVERGHFLDDYYILSSVVARYNRKLLELAQMREIENLDKIEREIFENLLNDVKKLGYRAFMLKLKSPAGIVQYYIIVPISLTHVAYITYSPHDEFEPQLHFFTVIFSRPVPYALLRKIMRDIIGTFEHASSLHADIRNGSSELIIDLAGRRYMKRRLAEYWQEYA